MALIEVPDNILKEVENLIKDKGASNAPDNKDIDTLIANKGTEDYIEYWGETIIAKRNWQSSPDHPKTFLAYITVAEAKMLRSMGLGYSEINGKYQQHYDKDKIPSFNGWGAGDSDYGGEQQSAEDAAGTSDRGGTGSNGRTGSQNAAAAEAAARAAQAEADSKSTYEKAVLAAKKAYEQNVARTFHIDHKTMVHMGYDFGYGYSSGFGVTKDQQSADMEAMSRAYAEFSGVQASTTLDNQMADTEALGYGLNFSVSTPLTEMAFSNSMFDLAAMSLEIAGVTTPNVPGAMSYTTRDIANNQYSYTTRDLNVLGSRTTLEFTATRVMGLMLGGYETTKDTVRSFGLDTQDIYTTNMLGAITNHTTTVNIGNSSFSYDTHYWSGNNTEYGFAAEIAADLAEFFGASTNTVRGISAAAEVLSAFFSTLMPSVQMLGVASALSKVNSTVSALMTIGSLVSIYEEMDRLSGMFTGKGLLDGWDSTGTSLSDSMLGNYGLGDGETYELGNIVEQDITDETIPFLIASNSSSQDMSMIPIAHTPTQFIKPNLNQENNMQSQQAVFIDYRGGLSEVLAPNLIGANEGSIFSNININKGTMINHKIGTVTNDIAINKYNMYLPNDYLFSSQYSYNAVKLGNFIYMTINDSSYPYIYQLDYQTLNTNCTEADLVQVSLAAPTTNPTVIDNLVSKAVVSIDVVDNDSPEDTTNNVQVGDIIQIYYGSTLVKSSTALVADDISEAIIEVVLDEYYPEDDEDLFGYRIYRGSTIIVPESNNIVIENESELEQELWEEYTYAYTYYDSDSGFESAPVFSDSFLKKTQAITIQDITYSTISTVDYIRVYRIGGYSSSYRLITELDNNVSGGTVSYVDSCSEEYIPTLLDTQNLSIVEDLKGLIEHKGTLFAYKNNQVYFSRPGKANMWSSFNSIRVGGAVSGLASAPLGTLIFTENSQTYLLGGTDKYNFTLSTLSKNIGCVSNRSIANYKNTCIWLDYEGLMMSVGSSVNNITKEKVNISNIGDIVESMVYDNVYYLVGSNYTLAIDFRYNAPSFQKLDAFEHMLYHKGKIYVQLNDTWYEDAFVNIGEELTMRYKAPRFIGNSYDILTEFNKINLTYKGDFTYKVYVDEEEVLSNTVSSEKVKVEEIKIPSSNNEGLGLELELIGKGEIKAFRYIFSNVNIN